MTAAAALCTRYPQRGRNHMEQQKKNDWALQQLNAAEAKVIRNIEQIGERFPTVARNGRYQTMEHPGEWTDGFWPGMLWLTYARTGEKKAKALAERCEERMDALLCMPENTAHDVGFMWTLSAVANYKLTKNPMSRRRGYRAAKYLASRFNPVGYIRSWGDIPGENTESWSIADNLMNLPILYWAAKEWAEPGFSMIAKRHTDTMLHTLLREDGSANHIIKLDPYTGEVIADRTDCARYTQGRNVDSAWTRGQAWVIYGMALGYRYTKCQQYLNAAKRCGHYFLAALDESGVPPIDFRYGSDEPGRDSSAGAIAACGLMEIADSAAEDEKNMYLGGAKKILEGLASHCLAEEENQNILKHGATHFHATDTRDVGLIYGDYFYMEALNRICGKPTIFW